MRRILVLLLLAALTVLAVGWFAHDPGTLAFTFRGWRVETSVGVAALVVVLVVVAAVVVASVIGTLLRAPARLRAWRAARRLRKGLSALAAGMVAVAAGDAGAARRAAKRAESVEGETPLTLLLAAQAAQLEGDDHAAEKYFTAMLARRETEFLALRGLLVQAMHAGNETRALDYARRAAKLRPDAGWAQAAEFELAVKAGQWKQAEDALSRAIRRGAVAPARGRRHRAALFLMQSRDAEAAGFDAEALALAKRAMRTADDFAPAALARARLEGTRGNAKRARRLLERAFAVVPHPDITAAYLAFAEGEGDARVHDRLRLATRLLERAPDALEARLAATEAAIAAGLWGKARKHLDDAEAAFDGAADGQGVPARLYRLRARLIEAEGGDAREAGTWLLRAAAAAPDARWVCGACGTAAPAWSGLCGTCRGFDTLEWRAPAPVAVLGADSPALAAIAAQPLAGTAPLTED